MKLFRKTILFIFIGILLSSIATNVNAAEKQLSTNSYVPNEGHAADVPSLTGIELSNGEQIVIGNYTIEYTEEIIRTPSYGRATTTSWAKTSHYKITNNGNEQEWYKIVQTTNYTYDGKTAKINTSKCSLDVTKYYTEGDYTVNINTVDNSSNTDPTYTIGLTMKFPSQSLTIIDVVTVHADGTHNFTHYS